MPRLRRFYKIVLRNSSYSKEASRRGFLANIDSSCTSTYCCCLCRISIYYSDSRFSALFFTTSLLLYLINLGFAVVQEPPINLLKDSNGFMYAISSSLKRFLVLRNSEGIFIFSKRFLIFFLLKNQFDLSVLIFNPISLSLKILSRNIYLLFSLLRLYLSC